VIQLYQIFDNNATLMECLWY